MRITPRVYAGLAAGAIFALIGQAATASSSVQSSTAGYGVGTISGATATGVSYTLSADGSTVTAATVVFAGDLRGKTITAGFNPAAGTALGSCSLGTGAYDSTANTTTATCSGLSQSTTSAASLAIAVR
jgi:hypothetical protein